MLKGLTANDWYCDCDDWGRLSALYNYLLVNFAARPLGTKGIPGCPRPTSKQWFELIQKTYLNSNGIVYMDATYQFPISVHEPYLDEEDHLAEIIKLACPHIQQALNNIFGVDSFWVFYANSEDWQDTDYDEDDLQECLRLEQEREIEFCNSI